MSKYTTELRYLIENNFDLGLQDYPIFEETYRPILNAKIIEHFYFREIGFETAELFKRFLNRTLNEIMPYYNQLYLSEKLDFNPLHNFDKYEEHGRGQGVTTKFDGWATDTQTETGNSNSDGNAHSTNGNTQETTGTVKVTAENLDVDSDTPQGMLSIGNIKGNTYASNAKMTEGTTRTQYDENGVPLTVTTNGADDSETHNTAAYSNNKNGHGESGTNTVQNLDEWIKRHYYGKSEGETYSEMLNKFRATFLNIDMLVIGELETCFMTIF